MAVAATAAVAVACGALTIAGARSGAAAPPPAALGAELFRAKGCVGCHTGPDSEAVIEVAPDLRLLPTVADHRVAGRTGREYVRQSIEEPQAFVVPGYADGFTLMPALPLTPAEIDALVAYLLP